MILSYDHFRLAGDYDLKTAAVFALQSPQGFAWNIHHNVIQNCVRLSRLVKVTADGQVV
ncbi:MAG: hypothetical protein HUU20_00745 [Pirellulales bacterium]|nr:hypothetical protein [Pirellulales bacterium]